MRPTLVACIAALLATPAVGYAQSVTCADGTTSEAGRGACSHRGGLAKTRASRESQPQHGVRCGDGSWSTRTGRGACSHHSGIADDGPIKPSKIDRGHSVRNSDVIARCEDGTISIAEGRGACSHHGGVDRHARPAPAQRTRTTTEPSPRDVDLGPAEPRARCRDGSLSYAAHHRGTCANHGGVREWLD